MPDEPSNGELARRLEAVHQDLKEDLRENARRLDGKVSVDVFKLEQAAQDRAQQDLAMRTAAIEDARRREAEQRDEDRRATAAQRAADRRLILTALVVPVLLLVLEVWLNAKGAGG